MDMSDPRRRARVIDALRSGVVPATGCTEPVSLAFAAARAARLLPVAVERIEGLVSANVMKNGMAVMVPGTEMPGLQVAAALGAIDGDPDAGLGVLNGAGAAGVGRARAMVSEGLVSVGVADVPDQLYAEVVLHGAGHSARVCIAGGHTHVFLEELDGAVVWETARPSPSHTSPAIELLRTLTLREVYEIATTAPSEQIDFMLEAERMNRELVEAGLAGHYGLDLGATMMRAASAGLGSDDLTTRMTALTAAASDARMGGAPLPAMTNAGSGNQGITATVPVTMAADHVGATDEQRIRALTLSHLTALYIHASLPVLSAFCAAATAGMGSAAGVAYLLDGRYETVERAVLTMCGDTVGMVCDGAAPSCTLKVASSVGSASRAVVLALAEQRVDGSNGIVCDDVDETIRGLGRLATTSSVATDPQILQIMLGKTRREPGATTQGGGAWSG